MLITTHCLIRFFRFFSDFFRVLPWPLPTSPRISIFHPGIFSSKRVLGCLGNGNPEIEETHLAQLDFFDSTLCLVKRWSNYAQLPVVSVYLYASVYLSSWGCGHSDSASCTCATEITITTTCFRRATRYPCHTIVSWLGIGSSSHPRGSETVWVWIACSESGVQNVRDAFARLIPRLRHLWVSQLGKHLGKMD